MELDGDLLVAHPAAGQATVLAARQHGVISRLLRGVALQISPPLVVTENELERIVDGIGAAVSATFASLR